MFIVLPLNIIILLQFFCSPVLFDDQILIPKIIYLEVSLFYVGLDWGKVLKEMAISRSFAAVLCGASLFSDDCEANFHTWT